MIGALAALPSPCRIAGVADGADVRTRTGHLAQVYGIVTAYLEEVMYDTLDHFPAGPADQREIQLIVWDAVNHDPDYDVVAWLSRAGCPLGLAAAA
jgi:hypothetical protein